MSRFGHMRKASAVFTVKSRYVRAASGGCPGKRPRLTRITVRRNRLLTGGLRELRGNGPVRPFRCQGLKSVTAMKHGHTITRFDDFGATK